MLKLIARVGDIVKHGSTPTGFILPVLNAIRSTCEGPMVAINGGEASCTGAGHHSPGIFNIIATSITVKVESQMIARDMDMLTCGAVIQSGAIRSKAGD